MQIIIIICKQKVNWTNALIIYLIGDENAFSNNFCNKCKFDLFYIAHSKHVKFSKTLSPKEEKVMLERMKNGDKSARAILIERNLRLVSHIVKNIIQKQMITMT